MLFYVSLALIAIGLVITARANRIYGDQAPHSTMRKVGWVVFFVGVAALMFVATCNILVWTGRAGVR